MSDNELDNLFKEAAEGFKTPNDPSAWADMSRRLDAAAVATASFWNWKVITSLGLVGVTGIALVVYFSLTDSKPETMTISEAALNQVVKQETTQVKPIETKTSETETINNETAETSPSDKIAQVNQIIQKNQNSEGSSAVKKEPRQNKLDNQTVENNQNTIQSHRAKQTSGNTNDANLEVSHRAESKATNLMPASDKPQVNDAANATDRNMNADKKSAENIAPVMAAGVGEKLASPGNVNAPQPNESNLNQSSLNQEGSSKATSSMNSTGSNVQAERLQVTDSLKKETADEKEEEIREVSEREEREQKDENPGFNRIAIKLAVAPDYSTVKSASPNSLGINYGVLFEYKINHHWSVASGGIWSKKIYSAYDVEYGSYDADWVDGDCRMWDIPINVYYNFTSKKPFSFYASVGLSSYLMKEENYVYYVETSYGTYDYPMQVKGENNEWFKTLNVSVGMQYRMSQQISLQFEPTLKAPLAGVGEGEVSLVSLGAFFNLRYEIPFNKFRRNED